jgi:hypothetical protein
MSAVSSLNVTDKIRNEPTETLTSMYLESLNERERKAYHIAKSHLGMSFTLEKSNGYLAWLKSRATST